MSHLWPRPCADNPTYLDHSKLADTKYIKTLVTLTSQEGKYPCYCRDCQSHGIVYAIHHNGHLWRDNTGRQRGQGADESASDFHKRQISEMLQYGFG